VITIGNFGEASGRLGNQLFQFALLFAVNHRHHFEFALPHAGEQLWDCFDLDIPAPSAPCPHRFRERYGPYNYDPGVFEQPDGTEYEGYFQSYRYTEECKEALTGALHFTATWRARAEACHFALRQQSDRPLVSVHVRRGDYVTHPENLWGDLFEDGYYRRVVERIGAEATYLVFSDDLPWCRLHLDLEPMVFVDLDAFSSLCLMTRCDVNVIANSSFSWWGAFLNPQADVYAPSRWFFPEMPPPRDRQDDVVPPTWRTVPVFADWTAARIATGAARQ
jgi:hypothetical protein